VPAHAPTHVLNPEIIALITQMLRQNGLGRGQLYALYVVGECGSIYRAAQELGLSGVPSARNRIRSLERGLKLCRGDLLVSDATGSMLTPLAHAVIELVRTEFDH
jgi:molybdenum-dependent DNA-binding transcriptional regulator ModE